MNYFDEFEVHAITLEVENKSVEYLMDKIINEVGKPHNYGPTPEEIAEKRRIEEEKKVIFNCLIFLFFFKKLYM